MRNPFGEGILERADIDLFHKRAVDELEAGRIKEGAFADIYGKDQVERDENIVKKQEEEFERSETPEQRELKKIADIFEAIVIEHGEMSEWFGGNASLIKTSKYDDYNNGIDAVIEYQYDEPKSSSFLGMAVDVTFRSDSTTKLDRIKRHIDGGRLGELKYFQSANQEFHGKLSKLPELVVGVDRKTILELAELWKGNRNQALGGHRVQIMLLIQMKDQLETFAMYAESLGKTEIAQVYRERLALISGILATKTDLYKKVVHELDNDPVHFNIMYASSRIRASLQKGETV